MASDAASGSQTLDRALAALVHIGECGARGLTLAECSASLGYSKPTAHRILRTLAARGFLRVDRERGLYSLGPANLRLGMAFLDQLDLRSEALPILRQLREQTVESEHAVRMFSRIGSTMPAYSTGVGKAILASLPPDELEQALPERLEARTPRTIVDRAKLRRHLAEVRRRGYSTDDIENEDGIRCVGAPVFDHSGHVCAGISVAGPATRVTPERFAELGLLVQEAAATISWRLGYGGAADRAGAAGAR